MLVASLPGRAWDKSWFQIQVKTLAMKQVRHIECKGWAAFATWSLRKQPAWHESKYSFPNASLIPHMSLDAPEQQFNCNYLITGCRVIASAFVLLDEIHAQWLYAIMHEIQNISLRHRSQLEPKLTIIFVLLPPSFVTTTPLPHLPPKHNTIHADAASNAVLASARRPRFTSSFHFICALPRYSLSGMAVTLRDYLNSPLRRLARA